ncbi:hypothetical protein KP509_38G052900 [Ceratopteris richardii]|uniref:Histone-lysine N-methyltransferase n=1 Tax=Ceratopteris richardii TaxID=49495 RepID=A0A8T2Q4W9_CERRI|nr:hypothetical protein KP509_38G052900 [Ceratopteris richardii]
MAGGNTRNSKRVLASDPALALPLQLGRKPKALADDDDIVCELCQLGDREDQLLLCDRCDQGFHSTCHRPIVFRIPSGPWLCHRCSSTRRPSIKEFPLVQTKIINFFRIQKSFHLGEGPKKRKRSSSKFVKKKSRRLLAFVPSKDPFQRLKQMASLATAMTCSGVKYSNELTYVPGLAPRAANNPSLEKGGMQVMNREDKAAYDQCKEMCTRGACPPLLVKFDPHEGFVVEADGCIKDFTIVAEYTGDVDYMSKRKHDDGDSLMGLLFTEKQSKDLVICPDNRGNIARFVSGINNHTREGKKKQNLRSVRFNIDGEAHALLIAIRDIHKGERLYYDYNGYQQDYPTEHFV